MKRASCWPAPMARCACSIHGRKRSLTIPANCLLFRAEGPQVGVVDASRHVDLRTVIVGRDFGQTIEILKGIAPGEQVILNPPDALVAGVEVRLSAPSASPAAAPAATPVK